MPRREDASGFPKERVVGMAGILDTRALDLHRLGDRRFGEGRDRRGARRPRRPDGARRLSHVVGGVPPEQLVEGDRVEAMVERTRKGGGEIVQLLGTG